MLSSIIPEFICSKCCKGCKGQFNYRSAILRLRDCSGPVFEYLSREKILLRNEKPLMDSNNFNIPIFKHCHPSLFQDRHALVAYQRCGNTDGRIPVRSSGDGNCLFNSVSIALFGNERFASMFRLLSAIEMFDNQVTYVNLHDCEMWCNINGDFEKALDDCARGRYVSGWAIHALATVVGRPICSVYPPMNGLTDVAFRILNTTQLC